MDNVSSLGDRLLRRDLHLSLEESVRRVRDDESAPSRARARLLSSDYRSSFISDAAHEFMDKRGTNSAASTRLGLDQCRKNA